MFYKLKYTYLNKTLAKQNVHVRYTMYIFRNDGDGNMKKIYKILESDHNILNESVFLEVVFLY